MKFEYTTYHEVVTTLITILKRTRAKNFDSPRVCAILEELGFKPSSRGTNGAWIHFEMGYVIKTPYICGYDDEDDADGEYTPKRAIPTVRVYDTVFKNVWIQPLAKTDSKSVSRAYEIMQNHIEKHNEYEYWGGDNHEGNIGIYKGKAVVFDW